jgi:hypothetical protein
MGPREILFSAVIPAFAALLLLVPAHALMARRSARRGSPASTLPWLALALLAGAVCLGSWAWQSRIELWPAAATHRFPPVALAALLVGLLAACTPLARRPALAALPAVAGGAFAAWAFLGVLHESLISEAARWGWIAALALLAGAQAWAIETGARALPGWHAPALLWALSGATALAATAGFANAPLVLFPVAAVGFALAIAGLLRRDDNLLRGLAPAFAVLLVGAAAFSNWFGDRERWLMLAALSAGPLMLAIAALPPLRAKPAVIRLTVVGVLSVLPAGIQAAIAVPALIKATEGGGSDYEY